MQRPRLRKSRSASGVEAIQHVQKPKAVPRLSTDSYSCADRSNPNDMFGQNSFNQDTCIPAKKFLGQEMSNEFETRGQSPGIIARLMGLEVLPSTKNVQRQRKKFIDQYDNNNGLPRRNSTEVQGFKDACDDLEAAHIANRRCSSKWNANSIFMEPDMAMMQEKSLSIHEKFQNSEQLNDTLELLESNEDLVVKFLHQPHSMFVNTVNPRQDDHKSSPSNHLAVLKPLNCGNCEGKDKSCGSGRHTSCKRNVTSYTRYEDGVPLELINQHRVHISQKSPNVLSQEKTDETILSTRIVVLKPNIGNMKNAGISCSSPGDKHLSAHRFRKMVKQHRYIGESERVLRRRNESHHKSGSSMTMPNEARELAREIAGKMRDVCDETMGMMSTGFFEYAGDESSCDPDETDYESDSEGYIPSSRKSFCSSNLYRYIESSANNEAKKRLSERWRVTHKYQDMEVVRKGSTLGEMLALPDRNARPKNLYAKSLNWTSKGLDGNTENAVLDCPLGISSRDGWKDEAIRSLSESRSLPPIIASCSKRGNRNKFCEGHLIHGQSARCSRSQLMKGKLSHQEGFSSKISRSRGKKPLSCSHMFSDEAESSSGASFETQMTSSTKDILEDPTTYTTDLKTEHCEIPVFDVTSTDELGSPTMSFDFLPQQPHSVIDGNSAAQDQLDSVCQDIHNGQYFQASHHIEAEPESLQGSKEADHSSPVSVLEIPFAEDAPSSESFERVSADIIGLRTRLNLLKMESGSFTESSTLEKEVEQLSPSSSEVLNHVQKLGAEDWEIHYALDVLIDSGLEESDFDIFTTTWYSHDSPLDPKLFDKLENKYSDGTNGLRSERKLLFDSINLSLSEIFENHVDLYPWVMMPRLVGSPLKLQKESARDALEKLINWNLLNGKFSDIILDREMQWPDLKGEVDVIGSNIESLLIDSMIIEILCS